MPTNDENFIPSNRRWSLNPIEPVPAAPKPGEIMTPLGFPEPGVLAVPTPEKDRPFNPCTGGGNLY